MQDRSYPRCSHHQQLSKRWRDPLPGIERVAQVSSGQARPVAVPETLVPGPCIGPSDSTRYPLWTSRLRHMLCAEDACERWCSPAAGSGSAADAFGSQLHALVRPVPARLLCRMMSLHRLLLGALTPTRAACGMSFIPPCVSRSAHRGSTNEPLCRIPANARSRHARVESYRSASVSTVDSRMSVLCRSNCPRDDPIGAHKKTAPATLAR